MRMKSNRCSVADGNPNAFLLELSNSFVRDALVCYDMLNLVEVADSAEAALTEFCAVSKNHCILSNINTALIEACLQQVGCCYAKIQVDTVYAKK